MARLHGEQSKYLLWRDKWAALFSLLYLLILFYIAWAVFVKSYKFLFTWSGVVVLLIVFGPLATYAYKKYIALNKESDDFDRGSEGEEIIRNELSKLSDEYAVFQDIKMNWWGNIDFAVIGPAGIFAIEVKSWGGSIRYSYWAVRQAKREAWYLNKLIQSKIGINEWVNPVLVYSNDDADLHFGMRPVNGVQIIQKRWLLKLLTERPSKFSSEKIKEIERVLLPLVKE